MENCVNEISVNGTVYVPKSTVTKQDYVGDIKIVILQRGWIMVGRFEKNGSDCKLHNASVIRTWGTSKGLGELAENGVFSGTRLDPCNGIVSFDYLTVVATIDCRGDKWQNEL